MKVRIKTKIAGAIWFIFALLVIVTVSSIWNLYRLRHDASEVLKDNYLTLTYMEVMRSALDRHDRLQIHGLTDLAPDSSRYLAAERDSLIQVFEQALRGQEANITEYGEGEQTGELRETFSRWRISSTAEAEARIRELLSNINTLNLQAITRKNTVATQTADQAITLLSIIGTILLLLSFSLIINFPGYIADPIAQLTAGIRQIAAKNYGERLHFEGTDEFSDVAAAFNEMAERLDAYEHSNLAELLFEKRRIEALIANLQDAVIGLDEHQHILFANSVACALLGIREADLLGRYAPDIALHNDLLRAILQTSEQAQPLKIFADGKESYFTKENVAVKVDHNKQTRAAGRVLILRNITPFKELDLAKTNFIATISHELKTPIAAIKMSVKLLGDQRVGDLNPEQQKLAGQISQESERLLRITGELLDVAQIETGNIRLSASPTHIQDLLDYATAAVHSQLADKRLRIEIKLEEPLPPLLIDAEKTAWVLVNLLTNASKYSPEGERIIVDARQQNSQVILSVQDFGPGIEEKYQQRLFEKFFQAPAASSGMTKTGSGLGLAISKDFIEAQGGKIWVHSQVGNGATFAFSLPVNG